MIERAAMILRRFPLSSLIPPFGTGRNSYLGTGSPGISEEGIIGRFVDGAGLSGLWPKSSSDIRTTRRKILLWKILLDNAE